MCHRLHRVGGSLTQRFILLHQFIAHLHQQIFSIRQPIDVAGKIVNSSLDQIDLPFLLMGHPLLGLGKRLAEGIAGDFFLEQQDQYLIDQEECLFQVFDAQEFPFIP